MEFKQLVMGDTDIIYRNMANGVTAAPMSRNASVYETNVYSQKRNNYIHRLERELDEFCAARKQITRAQKERLRREKQRSIEKQQKKEKTISKVKSIFFYIVVVSLTAVNLVLEKNVLGILIYNELNNLSMFSGVWSSLWPAWIVISASLLATAIMGRKMLKGQDASWFCFLEVGALLLFTLVLAFIFPPCDSIIENIIGLPILCAILYIVPVGVSGFISLAICGS